MVMAYEQSKREGWRVSRNRVYRLCVEEQIQLRLKLPTRHKTVMARRERHLPVRLSEVRSLDFVADQLTGYTRLRALGNC